MAKWDPEAYLFGKIERWFFLLTCLLLLACGWLFGWLVHHAISIPEEDRTWTDEAALAAAELPDQAVALLRSGLEFDDEGRLVQRNPQIIDFEEFSGLKVEDPEFEEDGMILVSAYSDAHGIATVYLYDLARQKKIWEWVPDHAAILEATPSLRDKVDRGISLDETTDAKRNFRSMHPYPLEDGRLLIHSGGGVLAMLDREGRPLWTLGGKYHHSIERMADGNFILNKILPDERYPFQNDGYVIVSPEGEVLAEKSLTEILDQHGYRGLLYGVQQWEPGFYDPVHLNDAEPILADDDWVRAGDIALSSRHLSTVLLYRPSEDRIVWLQTGPWLNQHDVDYQGDGVFSIFNNNAVRTQGHFLDASLSQRLADGAAFSTVDLYRMDDGSVTPEWPEVFRREELFTQTQGLHRRLENGDYFVELQNAHQLARVGPGGVRWRYAHPLSEPGQVGMLHWCRYFHPGELDLSWMEPAAGTGIDTPEDQRQQ
ncbi:MAG: arylsulfotransferase family protein [Verrucomicrobiota bacterium]